MRGGRMTVIWTGRRLMGAVYARGTCPLTGACLAYAVAADEREGIWGGTLPDERRVMRRAVA